MRIDVPRLLTALGIKAVSARGGSYSASCPYPDHRDSDPSWSIREDGSHYCFGCQRGGGPAELVEAAVELSGIPAALSWIRERGLYTNGAALRAPEKRPALIAAECFEPLGLDLGPMESWPTLAREYAARRLITPAQAARWGLGAGVAGRVAGRLWLPARRRDGTLASWTARAVDDREPRYKSAEPSDGMDPAQVFGERWWPEAARADEAEVVVCEGALNALACERAGATYLAALGGSRIEPGQVAKLSRFGAVALALDPDDAGERAARALTAALGRWRKVRRIELPADPCDVEQRQGAGKLAEILGVH